MAEFRRFGNLIIADSDNIFSVEHEHIADAANEVLIELGHEPLEIHFWIGMLRIIDNHNANTNTRGV